MYNELISLLIDIFPLMKKKMVYYILWEASSSSIPICMPVSLLRSQTRWAEIDLLVICNCKDAGRPHQVMSRDRAAWYGGAIGVQCNQHGHRTNHLRLRMEENIFGSCMCISQKGKDQDISVRRAAWAALIRPTLFGFPSPSASTRSATAIL
jgi:hypothetical protein